MPSSRSRRSAAPETLPAAGAAPEAEAMISSETAPEDVVGVGPRIELYLLRHADAGDPMAWHGDDDVRPLSGKGRRQARRIGRWLAELGRRPDVIMTSPRLRASETATIVAASLGLKPKVDARLAAVLDQDVLRGLIADSGADTRRLMLVGHDPDFSSMASALSGAPLSLRKGALARIDLPNGTATGSGTLRWLLPADAIPER